jgi:hypothetical protein
MMINRSILRIAAIVLFILAADFLIAVPSIRTNIDIGLIAVGLAAWAAA